MDVFQNVKVLAQIPETIQCPICDKEGVAEYISATNVRNYEGAFVKNGCLKILQYDSAFKDRAAIHAMNVINIDTLSGKVTAEHTYQNVIENKKIVTKKSVRDVMKSFLSITGLNIPIELAFKYCQTGAGPYHCILRCDLDINFQKGKAKLTKSSYGFKRLDSKTQISRRIDVYSDYATLWSENERSGGTGTGIYAKRIEGAVSQKRAVAFVREDRYSNLL